MGVVEVTGYKARRRELGACLRAYRQLIRPADVGLPDHGRRRTPGLRREEVATLAGVGLSWYTWLEQGRVTASHQVLDAVGRVLRLDRHARDHLRTLTAPPAPLPTHDILRAELGPLVESWTAGPAALLDHRLDLVAVNRTWAAAWNEPEALDPMRRNVVWLLAAHPRTPGPLPDAGPLVQQVARQLRMATNLHAGDARILEIGDLLRAEAPGLNPVWECRGVGAFEAPALRWAGGAARAYLLHPGGLPGVSILTIVPTDQRGEA
ncbi:helix-turn-helix transcriptional regulator [Pseudonocardia aurantiaca]|uniref:Helix-turn-helix domain-containing protein n=1 Tax=Pseudonocardia aurantiaca TaxID=75290 RepID=A0ABW4FKG4_9PSEU